MNTAVQKPKDPNWVCTFSLVRNKAKTEKKHPDMVLVDSEKMNKEGKPFKKNFTINGVWHEASGYIQEDKSVKITIKKSSSSGPTPAPKADAADWDDQF
jgi:hypothetical protein|tara:strand:- start:84 stop:380 length:297 start_codon:yes stop_codon:yes gene_type:complete